MAMRETKPINFERARDSDSRSWQRACDKPCLIERVGWDRWKVFFRDSENVHLVQLHRDHGAYLGSCHVDDDDDREECPGWAYHDGPCAHLCAIRHAAYGQQPGEPGDPLTDTRGQPVRIYDIEAVGAAAADHYAEPENRPVADGGVRR